MFKAKARRDALMARWAATQLGLSGADAEAYVQSLVTLSVQKDHEQVLVKKMLADFEKAKVSIPSASCASNCPSFRPLAATQVLPRSRASRIRGYGSRFSTLSLPSSPDCHETRQ
jgi:Uncharacterized conserved protein